MESFWWTFHILNWLKKFFFRFYFETYLFMFILHIVPNQPKPKWIIDKFVMDSNIMRHFGLIHFTKTKVKLAKTCPSPKIMKAETNVVRKPKAKSSVLQQWAHFISFCFLVVCLRPLHIISSPSPHAYFAQYPSTQMYFWEITCL